MRFIEFKDRKGNPVFVNLFNVAYLAPAGKNQKSEGTLIYFSSKEFIYVNGSYESVSAAVTRFI